MSESVLGTDQTQVDTSYCFKWSNYQSHLSEVVRQLLEEECMVDVTLYAGGERIQAHRLVLCACSTLFQEILSQVNDEHATIILSDISPQDVRSIVEFSYNGEVRIPVENINNLLDAAHSLKICGLMEIEGLDESEISQDKDITADDSYVLSEFPQVDEEDESIQSTDFEKSHAQKTSENKRKISTNDEEEEMDEILKRRKRRKSVCKKEYSDEMLAAAISDIKEGRSLLEAAIRNHIPRSTLYMRAKVLVNTQTKICKELYKQSWLDLAYNRHLTVMFCGEEFKKKAVYHLDTKKKNSYAADRREAAVKALERGDSLTKVANEYKIPKTTLFRDKARLVDQGKLPSTFWKKRKSDGEELKRSRLEEAVAACKEGKMSQAVASVTYQIPKTTIWRRLQKEVGKSDSGSSVKKQQKRALSTAQKSAEIIKSQELQETDFEAYCPEDTDMNITYIDESNMTDDPVIILASGDVDELNLPNNRSLVVVHEGTDDNFISCGLELDENTTFVEKS
ncbi:hypothetical protein TSAR_002074 [Trichomalopsis sarcophagae]|uniref:BTB domain-containing protein n=1 Tax=Trichomalopsis sarcophagae TaxID=543379 RepID=A0A232ESY3_9HYME|nr:hypothetical protein TSAR_002074 [Trichomalopsis sarcophagae]